jgi:hypothetical protein
MKPFVRIKTIRGHEYLYEITPYYDRTLGKVRQRSRYIGKKEGRAAYPQARAGKRDSSRTLSAGEYLPFLAVTRDLGLERALTSLLRPEDAATVLSLVNCLAARPCPLPVLQDWYERCAVSLVYPAADLRPGKVLRLLQNLADFRILERFSALRHRPVSAGDAVFIVSLIDEEASAFLKEYHPPGSDPPDRYYEVSCSPDSCTLSGCRRLPDSFRSRLPSLTADPSPKGGSPVVVFPEGAISSGHLVPLAETGCSFVLAVPPLRVLGRESGRRILRSVMADFNFRTLRDEPVYARACPVTIGSHIFPGFLILSTTAERIAKLRMHREIYRTTEDLKSAIVLPQVGPEGTVREVSGDLSSLFSWSERGGRIQAVPDHNAVNLSMLEAGMLLVLHRGQLRREECVALLHQRRTFNAILSERNRELMRMLGRESSDRMEEGIFFVSLMAAALRWRLEALLPRIKGRAGTSPEALMVSLSSITVTAGPGRRREAGSIVRGQRTILTVLSCIPEQVIPRCSQARSLLLREENADPMREPVGEP